MKPTLAILALLSMVSITVAGQTPSVKDPLLDHLAGRWVLRGTIAHRETTHDIEAEWMLNHEYLRIHETSRDKNAEGQPAYEAIIIIEWNESSGEYRCLWLDSTAGGGLTVPTAPGKRGNDDITFAFKDKDKDSGVRTNFAYSKDTDTWQWLIDNVDGGKVSNFARVTLSRT